MKGYTIQHSIKKLEDEVDKLQTTPASSDASDIDYDNTESGLTGDNVQEAIDELNTKIGTIYPCNFSTTEHKVGTWIDGRDIFEKTLEISALPSAAGIGTYPLGVSDGALCWIEQAITSTGDGLDFMRSDYANYSEFHEASIGVRSALSDGAINVYVYVGKDRSSLGATVTVRYVKIAPEPTPEANTRKKSSKK